MQHFQVDENHSDSYEVWKKMDSPQQPNAAQYAALEQAGQLAQAESPRWMQSDGTAHLKFDLPLHGVALIRFTW